MSSTNATSGTPRRTSLLPANPPDPRRASDRAENQPARRNSGPSAKVAPISAGPDNNTSHTSEVVRSW
jgi:hypothetical protein